MKRIVGHHRAERPWLIEYPRWEFSYWDERGRAVFQTELGNITLSRWESDALRKFAEGGDLCLNLQPYPGTAPGSKGLHPNAAGAEWEFVRWDERNRAEFLNEYGQYVTLRSWESIALMELSGYEDLYLDRRINPNALRAYIAHHWQRTEGIEHRLWLMKYRFRQVRLFSRGSPRTTLHRAPGYKLLWLAELLYSPRTCEEILSPTVSDMQEEYNIALAEGRLAKARYVRVRGTWAFFYAAGLQTWGNLLVPLLNLLRRLTP